jgi:hypothetical protein
MLEIQTKRLEPGIVVLEVTGRITIGRECKQLDISGFEVYGDPGPEAGKMLTGVGAEIFGYWQGLPRFARRRIVCETSEVAPQALQRSTHDEWL